VSSATNAAPSGCAEHSRSARSIARLVFVTTWDRTVSAGRCYLAANRCRTRRHGCRRRRGVRPGFFVLPLTGARCRGCRFIGPKSSTQKTTAVIWGDLAVGDRVQVRDPPFLRDRGYVHARGLTAGPSRAAPGHHHGAARPTARGFMLPRGDGQVASFPTGQQVGAIQRA
jgi:hypothetical protein